MTFNRLDTAFCGAIIVVVALAVVLPTATASTAAREGSESFRRAHPLSTLVVPENKDTPRLIRLHDDGTGCHRTLYPCFLHMSCLCLGALGENAKLLIRTAQRGC